MCRGPDPGVVDDGSAGVGLRRNLEQHARIDRTVRAGPVFESPTTVPASCRIAPPVRSQRSWRARTVKRGWRPQVGRQHAHRVVVLVPPSHHVGVEDANPAGRRSGCCDATVVKPCGGEEQVDSGPSSGPTSSQPSASAVVRPRPATAASEPAALIAAGAVCGWRWCLCWPESPPTAGTAGTLPGQSAMVEYGVRLGLAGAVCAGLGSPSTSHKGWATARQRSSRVQCGAWRGSEIRLAGLLRTLKRGHPERVIRRPLPSPLR